MPVVTSHQSGEEAPGGRAQPEGDEQRVLAAVGSLYADGLRPYGRILRKRLAEHLAASLPGGNKSIDVDIERLRATCLGCARLRVLPEEAGDWAVLLRGRPDAFVDIYAMEDAYPAGLWRQAAAYFDGAGAAALPGGRYACARELMQRQLPFLAGYSLGQICHIVQLAISQKKILGYLNGAVVLHSRSQSLVKESYADQHRPCGRASGSASEVADWDAVRRCVGEIVDSRILRDTGSMPLSNLKRLFRSRFQLVLSETALGHTKLSELLQDPRLADLCALRQQGHGFVVVPPTSAEAKPRTAISLVDCLGSVRGSSMGEPEGASSLHCRAKWVRPLCLEEVLGPSVPGPRTPPPAAAPQALPCLLKLLLPPCDITRAGLGGNFVKNTFIHAPTSPVPRSSRRTQTLPKNLGSNKDEWEASCYALGFRPRPVDDDEGADSCSTGTPSSNSSRGCAHFSIADSLACGATAAASWEGLREDGHPHSVARNGASERGPVPAAPSLSLSPVAAPSQVLVTLPALDCIGLGVRNTFIHVPLPPPSPAAGSSCRAQSAPRSMGSTMREDEAWGYSARGTPAQLGPGDGRTGGTRPILFHHRHARHCSMGLFSGLAA